MMIYVLHINHVFDIPDICIVYISYIKLQIANMMYARDIFIDKHTMSIFFVCYFAIALEYYIFSSR